MSQSLLAGALLGVGFTEALRRIAPTLIRRESLWFVIAAIVLGAVVCQVLDVLVFKTQISFGMALGPVLGVGLIITVIVVRFCTNSRR